MFYYVSFLRPPPTSISISGKLSVVPQIANDLRTEFFVGSQDIFYSWHNGTTSQTSPIKLTTWRQETTYRELPVPLPPNARDGQSWRLLLSSAPHTNAIDLVDLTKLGTRPFGVMSLPIHMLRGGGGNAKKQERIERVYDLGSSKMKITEQTSFDLDKKIWDSGIGLSSWLVNGSTNRSLPEVLQRALFSREPRQILELGAGTGIVAMTVGALRRNGLREGAIDEDSHIFTTDLASAIPLLGHNISSNMHLYPPPFTCPMPEVLNWEEELPEFTAVGFNAILMADVTYNTASFPALFRTLDRLVKLSPEPPVIVLGYKQRDDAERTLWSMAKDIGVDFKHLDDVKGAGGNPIEIWMFAPPGSVSDVA